MKHRLALAVAIALASAAAPALAQTSTQAPSAVNNQANPLFADSPLPLHYPQFDKIKDSDFAPAFDRGMAEQMQEINAIANSRSAPTFENTIVPMEKSGQLLTRANTIFQNLSGADTNDARDKLDEEYSPKFAAHFDAIYLNGPLFKRVEKIYEGRDKLDAESKRLVEEYYKDFVRAGAKLTDAQQVRVKAINAELASLGAKFSQNVLK